MGVFVSSFRCRYTRLYASENPSDVAAVLNIDGAITDASDWQAARPAFTLLSPAAFKLCRLPAWRVRVRWLCSPQLTLHIRTFLEPLGIIDLVATQFLTRIMNSYLAKPIPDQDRFLRRFIQVRDVSGCSVRRERWPGFGCAARVTPPCSRVTAPLLALKLRLLNRGLRW